MEVIMLAVVAVVFVVMYFTFTSMFGTKPAPVDFDVAGSASPNKKTKKKKTTKAAPVTAKWDAPVHVKEEKPEGAKSSDKFFDPVKQGEMIVSSAAKSAQDEKAAATGQQLSQRQRNKLQAQGFVTENKTKPKRASSRDKVETDETAGKYDDLTAEQAERMLLLEKIASGQRATDIFGGGSDRPRKPRTDDSKEKDDAKRQFDQEQIKKRLDDAKKEKEEARLAKTRVGGGRIVMQGAGALAKPPTNAWARAASPPAQEETPAAPEPAPEAAEEQAVAEEE